MNRMSESDSQPYLKALVLLSLVMLAGLGMRILCYDGVGIPDELGYLHAAGNLAKGVYPWTNYPAAYVCTGFVIPLAPLVALGGYSSWLPTVYSLTCGIGLIGITYWLGVQLVGRSAGLWAAFVVAFSTLAIGTAMSAMPDTPRAFWAALGIAIVLHARSVQTPRSTFFVCLLAGGALGLAALTKITSIFIFPVVLLALILLPQRRLVALLGGISGFLLIMAMSAIFWGYVTESPWTGFEIWAGLGSSGNASSGTAPPRSSLWHFPIKMFVVVSVDGLFYYYLVPALVWALWKAPRKLWLPAAWVIIVFLCFQFGATSISPYKPFPHNPRYLMLLLPAGAILIGAAFSTLAAKRRRLAFCAIALYVMGNCFFAFLQPATRIPDMLVAKAAVEYLEGKDAPEVLTDRCFLQYFNHVQRDYRESVPAATPWIGENLVPQDIPADASGIFVVRYDGTIWRFWLTKGKVERPPFSSTYGFLEQHAKKTVIDVEYAHLQRAALGTLSWVIRKMPLPENVDKRLEETLSRHLADQSLIIYRLPAS